MRPGRWVLGRLRRLPAAVGYLAMGGLTALLSMFAVVGLAVVGAFCLIGLGIPAVPEAVRLVRRLVGVDRRQAARYLGEPIAAPYQPMTGSLREQLATVARDPANLRDLGWLVLHAVTGTLVGSVAILLPFAVLNQALVPAYWRLTPPGSVTNFGFTVTSWGTAFAAALIALPLGWLALQTPAVAGLTARTAAALLAPADGAELAHRVAELTATRAAALDAHGAELRRIERDLHDGAQARIAAVIMQLGLAEQLRERDPGAADAMVRTAQDTATAALAELRDVVRTVYPPVLADRGLASAISALAARSPIPCVVEIEPGARRPAAVEAAAYFVIAEALTNATKHSRAEQVSVRLAGPPATLTVTVSDDGIGGARESEGGGLAGIRRRAAALDGSMVLTSPAGGPTVVRVELPCGS
ncbi:sensor histidine kinase [Nocardia sp. NPDC057668]|uniref:sensor histidine kinase n=1 Tax=Nocardia sp. NPDC057668 TaxID=3346202 RepID=UPI003671D8E2